MNVIETTRSVCENECVYVCWNPMPFETIQRKSLHLWFSDRFQSNFHENRLEISQWFYIIRRNNQMKMLRRKKDKIFCRNATLENTEHRTVETEKDHHFTIKRTQTALQRYFLRFTLIFSPNVLSVRIGSVCMNKWTLNCGLGVAYHAKAWICWCWFFFRVYICCRQ